MGGGCQISPSGRGAPLFFLPKQLVPLRLGYSRECFPRGGGGGTTPHPPTGGVGFPLRRGGWQPPVKLVLFLFENPHAQRFLRPRGVLAPKGAWTFSSFPPGISLLPEFCPRFGGGSPLENIFPQTFVFWPSRGVGGGGSLRFPQVHSGGEGGPGVIIGSPFSDSPKGVIFFFWGGGEPWKYYLSVPFDPPLRGGGGGGGGYPQGESGRDFFCLGGGKHG